MKVYELKQLLEDVIESNAEVRTGSEDDNFFDGEVVTGIQIIHNMVDGKNICRVFIVGDANAVENTETK